MAAFEPRFSGVRSNRSSKSGTTIEIAFLDFINQQSFNNLNLNRSFNPDGEGLQPLG